MELELLVELFQIRENLAENSSIKCMNNTDMDIKIYTRWLQ